MSRALIPMFLLLAAPAAAQPPAPFAARDPARTNVTSALRLYADPVVQAELKLTAEQKAKLAKIPEELLAKHKDALAKEEAERKEANAKTAAKRADLEKQFDALLEKHLTATQRTRLNQLALQSRGVTALRDEAVVKALGLPADAPAKLSELMRAGTEKLRAEFPDGPFRTTRADADTDASRKYADATRKMQQDVTAKFVGTFTAEQKKAWADMIGEPSAAVAPAGGTNRPATLSILFSPATRVYNVYAILTNEKVLDELKVEKPARDAIAEGLKAVQQAAREVGLPSGLLGGFRSSIAFTLGTEASAAAAAALTAPQTKRLEQIQFQLRGTNVFTGVTTFGTNPFDRSPVIGRGAENPLRKLTLTPAQVVKIDAVLADVAQKRRPLGSPPLLGRDGETEVQKAARRELQQKVAAIEKAALAEIAATFDAGQKSVWKDYTGELIDVAKVEAYTPTRTTLAVGRGRGTRSSIIFLWVQEASRRRVAGEYAAALAVYDDALRLVPADSQILQLKAGLLATCPSEWVRDGKQAVELMTKVMAEVKEPTHAHHDTMASALAEAGRFDDAVAAQEKAIAGLPPPPAVRQDLPEGIRPFDPSATLKPAYEARLKLFREKKPYRAPLPQRGNPSD